MAESKTRPTDASVPCFLGGIADEQRRNDAVAICEMLAEVSGEVPVMWGPSIVGFGTKPYTTADGRTTDWFRIGFSPRKTTFAMYAMANHDPALLANLGKHTLGVGCLYFNRLADIDRDALRALVELSVATAEP